MKLISPNEIPSVVKNYLLEIKPETVEPPVPPYMHGFILGSYTDISYQNQLEIEKQIMVGM